MNRSAGVLLSITSLPSKYGIGCLDQAAYDFVDWLAEAGQTYWQILPLGPTIYGGSCDSPYQAYSAFAGNPYMISLDALIEEKLLTQKEVDAADMEGADGNVDFEKLHNERYKLLRKAFERSDLANDKEYAKFIEENNWWAHDYCMYKALKEFFGIDHPWMDWPEDIRRRWDYAMDYYNDKLKEEIAFHKFMQYKFFTQWTKLKKYANDHKIKILGDIPIYVSLDSSDAWAHPDLFQLNSEGFPARISGCPPDALSEDGQIWGNPLYRWDYHKQTDYEWWSSRIYQSFRLYDTVRIDHFRGLDEYFAIPAGENTAKNGKWEKGPGMDLFKRLEAKLGKHEYVAEDLGTITDSVRKLVKDSGCPNMKVIEFAFDDWDIGGTNLYLPCNYDKNCFAYTGTHDNDTLIGWWESLKPESQKIIRTYMGDNTTPDSEINWAIIRMLMASTARTVIVPIQDYLALDGSCRMNLPGTTENNWTWRLKGGECTEELGKKAKELIYIYYRRNWDYENAKAEKEKKAKAAAEKAKAEKSEK